MLWADGPHLFAIALKFPLIHRTTCTESRKQTTVVFRGIYEDEVALLLHFTKRKMKIELHNLRLRFDFVLFS